MSHNNILLASLVFYAAVMVCTIYYAIRARKSSVFDPIIQMIFFTSLFTIPLPLRAWYTTDIDGDISPYLPLFEPYLPAAVFLTAVSLPIFCIVYYSRASIRLANIIPQVEDLNKTGFRIGTYLLIAASFTLLYQLGKEQGGITQFLLLGYKSSDQTFGQGYLAVGFPWLIVAMMAQFESWVQTRFKPDIIGFAILFVTNMAINVVTGNRGMILYMMIVIIVFWNFRIRRVKLRYFIPIAGVAFIALNILGLTRGSHFSDFGDFVSSTTETANRLSSTEEGGLFYTLTTGEFVVPFETFPQMIRTVGSEDMPPWLGLSLIRAPVFAIPSVFYPDRPLPLTSWYMENFYGGGYLLNEGRAFFFLAEGYLNFGPFGVIVIAALWGLLWGALNIWAKRFSHHPLTVLVLALLVGFMPRCVAGDTTTLFIATTQQSLAGVILIVWFSKLVGFGKVSSRPPGHKQPSRSQLR